MPKRGSLGIQIESATAATIAYLSNLPKRRGQTHDASPNAIAELKKSLTAEQIEGAPVSPKPTTLELTDILLDAWSMTTIAEAMPGRPPVAPWLRGVDDDLPQTTIAWRAELDLVGFDQLDKTISKSGLIPIASCPMKR